MRFLLVLFILLSAYSSLLSEEIDTNENNNTNNLYINTNENNNTNNLYINTNENNTNTTIYLYVNKDYTNVINIDTNKE